MSIKAMNWAMEQATGDPRSQCLLYVIADCANQDGIAWPSVKYMASKSQQSKATTQRRLKELEEMGAIARFPRWEDEDGKVNSDGRGRRTSDEIRCLLDCKIDHSAADEGDADGSESSTPPSQPDTPPSQPDTGPVAQLSDGPPSHCSDPYMNRNSEPERVPPTPQGGSGTDAVDQGSEAKLWPGSDTWPAFEKAYHEPIGRQSLARQVWSALTDEERALATKAARGYMNWRRGQRKPPNVLNAHTFLRERDAWPRYAELAGPDPSQRTFVVDGSPTYRALEVVARIGGWKLPPSNFDVTQNARGFWRKTAVPIDLQGLAIFTDKPIEEWQWLDGGTKQFFAWAGRMREWTGHCPDNMRVPCPFPPRRDGTISPPLADTG